MILKNLRQKCILPKRCSMSIDRNALFVQKALTVTHASSNNVYYCFVHVRGNNPKSDVKWFLYHMPRDTKSPASLYTKVKCPCFLINRNSKSNARLFIIQSGSVISWKIWGFGHSRNLLPYSLTINPTFNYQRNSTEITKKSNMPSKESTS